MAFDPVPWRERIVGPDGKLTTAGIVWFRWLDKLRSASVASADLDILQAASDGEGMGGAESALSDLGRQVAVQADCHDYSGELDELERQQFALPDSGRDWSKEIEEISRELKTLDASTGSTGGLDARVAALEALTARLDVLVAAVEQTASVRAEIDALEKLFWTSDTPVRPDPSPTGYAKVVTTTASMTVGNETVILCNAVGGAIVVTLLAAAVAINRVYHVKKIDTSAYTVTVTPAGAETVDGAATMVLSTPYEDIHIVSSGAAWFIL